MATENATPRDPDNARQEQMREEEDQGTRAFEDLLSAIIFIVIGVAGFVLAQEYRTGTLQRMGPGMFPLMISGLLTAIGVGLAVQTLLSGRLKHVPSVIPTSTTVRSLFFVMLSLFVFAMLIQTAGLFIASAAQVFIATRAEPGRKVIGSVILSLTLATLAALIFVYGIGLPIPLWP